MPVLSELSDPKFTLALIGGAFGIVSTLIPIADKWVRDHTARQRASEDLETLTKRVAFLDAWFKTATLVNGSNSSLEMNTTVQQELLQLAKLYAARSMPIIKATLVEAQQIPKSAIRRALLIYLPRRRIAWIPRLFFYGFASYCVAIIAELRPKTGLYDPLVWAFFFILIALAWVFRYFSLRMQSAISPGILPKL